MTGVLYPVADTAEAALHAPLGFAVREREATAIAAAAVAFATEATGPVFASREAAQAAYGGAPAGGAALANGWARLTQVAAEGSAAALRPARPVYAEGRRWPTPPPAPPAHWRLWVSYWRTGEGAQAGPPAPDRAARRLRRSAEGGALDPSILNALARQPLRPVRPQQPLDIGLFEAPRPEAPGLIIPDE